MISSPFQHSGNDTSRMMLLVIAATIPGVLMASWWFGYGVIINIVLASCLALTLEAIMLSLQGKAVRSHLSDNSALVTAVLFAITIPPGTPFWLLGLGIFFAIVIAKHLYGGLGQNPFNPAMAGYLLLLLAFPLQMTAWHVPALVNSDQLAIMPYGLEGLLQSLSFTFPLTENSIKTIDGFAMATPLIESKMAGTSAILEAINNDVSVFNRQAETSWELINIFYLLGGLFLLYKRIISWHIPLSILVTVCAVSALYYSPGGYAVYGTPYLHLLGSATMVGAFFIATDPVSAATTTRGKIIYGIIIGLAIYSIRVWGSYVDSIAIAVLFGNFCAPLIDRYSQPRIYGHKRRRFDPNEDQGQ